MRYYAVKKGFETGIYTSWDECFDKVICYSGADYKSFSTRKEAEKYMMVEKKKEAAPRILTAYVDGSVSDKVNAYSYGCIFIEHDVVINELYGKDDNTELLSMRNVAGEILGARVAVEYALNHSYDEIHIYYDYRGIEKWATGGWRANKQGTREYATFMKNAMKQIEIKFNKVKAHTGVKYNERADKLAKYAFEKG